ncbi:transposase family protein [Microcoleus sp. Pol12A5]
MQFHSKLLLVYLPQSSSFEYLGIQFEVSESAAHNIFPYWLVILG